MLRPSLLVVAAVLGIGCGDNLAPLALDDLELARHTAVCERLVRCGLYADQATCEATFRSSTDPDLAAAVHDGIIAYDGGNAEACLAAIAAQSCDVTSREARRLPPSCDHILTGTRDAGETCYFDAECASGDCAEASCPRDLCCAGACAPVRAPVAIDGACETTRDCVDQAFCGRDHVCHALATMGQACDLDADCAYGLACIGAGIDPGACRALPALGEACPYLRCADLGALCSASGVCAAAGPGAACTSDADCSTVGQCDPAMHVCTGFPTLGMPCITRCVGDAWCNHAVGQPMCEAPLATGSPCNTDDQCATLVCEEGPIFDTCIAPAVCF